MIPQEPDHIHQAVCEGSWSGQAPLGAHRSAKVGVTVSRQALITWLSHPGAAEGGEEGYDRGLLPAEVGPWTSEEVGLFI